MLNPAVPSSVLIDAVCRSVGTVLLNSDAKHMLGFIK